jgi:hypothetical protein
MPRRANERNATYILVGDNGDRVIPDFLDFLKDVVRRSPVLAFIELITESYVRGEYLGFSDVRPRGAYTHGCNWNACKGIHPTGFSEES